MEDIFSAEPSLTSIYIDFSTGKMFYNILDSETYIERYGIEFNITNKVIDYLFADGWEIVYDKGMILHLS